MSAAEFHGLPVVAEGPGWFLLGDEESGHEVHFLTGELAEREVRAAISPEEVQVVQHDPKGRERLFGRLVDENPRVPPASWEPTRVLARGEGWELYQRARHWGLRFEGGGRMVHGGVTESEARAIVADPGAVAPVMRRLERMHSR